MISSRTPPLTIDIPGFRSVSPRNYTNEFQAVPVTLTQALAASLNIPRRENFPRGWPRECNATVGQPAFGIDARFGDCPRLGAGGRLWHPCPWK